MADLAAPTAISEKVRRYKKKQRDLERTVEKLQEEMKEMRAQHATIQSTMVVTLQSHERSIKKLEERMDCVEELEGCINSVEEEVEGVRNDHAAHMADLERRLTQRLRLDDFCNTNAESMSNYMLNNQCGLHYLDKTHKEQLASLEKRLTQRLDDVQETNKTTVKNDDVHLARLDEAHQEQLASLEARLTKRLDDMSKTNAESLHSNRLSNQCGLAYLEKTHKEQLTSLGARLTKRMGDVLLENNKATLLSLVKSQDDHRACVDQAHKEDMASLEARLSRRLEGVEASSQHNTQYSREHSTELACIKVVLASLEYRLRAQDPRCSDAARSDLENKARKLLAVAADIDKFGKMPSLFKPQAQTFEAGEPSSPEASSQTANLAKMGWENPAWRYAYLAADKPTRRSMIRNAQWG